MRVEFHKHFLKSYRKLRQKERQQCDERLALFTQDRMYPLLHDHELVGDYVGYRSINITGDLRAVYKEIAGGLCIFVDIGTHGELYEK